jgi:hypothetical protein
MVFDDLSDGIGFSSVLPGRPKIARRPQTRRQRQFMVFYDLQRAACQAV